MSNSYYELYCDESGIDRGIFYFGAIHCSNARAGILSNYVTAFRSDYGMFSEMKWGKVSGKKLSEYKAFVDIFLDDPYASFIISEVIRGRHWRKLGKSNDEIFMNAYFHFLEDAMLGNFSNRYAIYLDGSDIKQYRFDALKFVLNKPSVSYGYQKKVHHLERVSSREHNLIQLVDVILGALSSNATANSKRELADYVKCKFTQNTKTQGMAKLRTMEWITPEHRRFIPNL